MKKCCLCIPILEGAATLGIISLLFCLLTFVVTIPFIAQLESFNPLNDTLEQFYPHVSTFIDLFNVSSNASQRIWDEAQEYIWYIVLGEVIASGVYFVLALIMIVGVCWDMRFLMIPHLVVHMLYSILTIVVGLGVTVIFCFGEEPGDLGTISAAGVLILAFCFIYSWTVIQKAYIELNDQDHMYKPAPMESISDIGQPRNLSYAGSGRGLYPTFQLQELDSFV